ncbi:MAG: LytTR family transcriptional regulator DNA-binding domain-containing protein [Rhodospirillales bacterium]
MTVASKSNGSLSPVADIAYSGMDVWPSLDRLDTAQAVAPGVEFEVAKVLLQGPVAETARRALGLVGVHIDADRAWTVSYNDSLSTFRDTDEWCLGGVETHNIDHLDIPSTALGVMHRLMREGHPVTAHDVDAMPRSMRALQTKLQLQETKSTLGVPMFHEGRLRGIIGLDMTRGHRRWDGDVVLAMCRLAELFAAAMFGGARDQTVQESPTPAEEAFLYFQGVRGIVGANIEDIVACSAERDSARVYLAGGRNVLDNRSLKWWESVLPESRFMRVHRSTILQLRAVRELRCRSTGQWVARIVDQDATFGVSRSRVAVLRNRLGY